MWNNIRHIFNCGILPQKMAYYPKRQCNTLFLFTSVIIVCLKERESQRRCNATDDFTNGRGSVLQDSRKAYVCIIIGWCEKPYIFFCVQNNNPNSLNIFFYTDIKSWQLGKLSECLQLEAKVSPKKNADYISIFGKRIDREWSNKHPMKNI